MSERFFEVDGIAFVETSHPRKIFRLEGDKRVDISEFSIAWEIPLKEVEVSRERAMELAERFS